jgi:hypothetical protein
MTLLQFALLGLDNFNTQTVDKINWMTRCHHNFLRLLTGLTGLDDNLTPGEPMTTNSQIKSNVHGKKKTKLTVRLIDQLLCKTFCNRLARDSYDKLKASTH